MPEPKYPFIRVGLIGEDGNAMAIVGKVAKALRRGGVSEEDVSDFGNEALSGDYDHVLQTCLAWVEVE